MESLRALNQDWIPNWKRTSSRIWQDQESTSSLQHLPSDFGISTYEHYFPPWFPQIEMADLCSEKVSGSSFYLGLSFKSCRVYCKYRYKSDNNRKKKQPYKESVEHIGGQYPLFLYFFRLVAIFDVFCQNFDSERLGYRELCFLFLNRRCTKKTAKWFISEHPTRTSKQNT